jgi:hypothetical protein
MLLTPFADKRSVKNEHYLRMLLVRVCMFVVSADVWVPNSLQLLLCTYYACYCLLLCC